MVNSLPMSTENKVIEKRKISRREIIHNHLAASSFGSFIVAACITVESSVKAAIDNFQLYNQPLPLETLDLTTGFFFGAMVYNVLKPFYDRRASEREPNDIQHNRNTLVASISSGASVSTLLFSLAPTIRAAVGYHHIPRTLLEVYGAVGTLGLVGVWNAVRPYYVGEKSSDNTRVTMIQLQSQQITES